jgi:hypothetical protein
MKKAHTSAELLLWFEQVLLAVQTNSHARRPTFSKSRSELENPGDLSPFNGGVVVPPGRKLTVALRFSLFASSWSAPESPLRLSALGPGGRFRSGDCVQGA